MSSDVDTAVNQQDSKPKNIVILGGSFAGVSIAHYVLKHVIPVLPVNTVHRVILVSAASQAMCRPACPRAMISDEFFDQSQLFVSIEKQFLRYHDDHFRFVHGTATKLDHENRAVVVKLANGGIEDIDYHALVIATGASTPSPLLGLDTDADNLKSEWKKFRAALPNATSIVIAGGGPTGIETAGELGEYLNGRPKMFGSKQNPKVPITVVTSGSQILPFLRPSLATKAEAALAKVGVTVLKNTRVKLSQASTDDETNKNDDSNTSNAKSHDIYGEKTTIHLDNNETLEADIYIVAAGTKPNTSFIDPALLTPDHRVETNSTTLRVDKAGERVYAIGDASSYARPAIHIIMDAVPVLGANIKRDLQLASGKEGSFVNPEREFKEDKRETQMVPIGKGAGVGSAMGYAVPAKVVWAIKGRDYWVWTTKNLWSGKQWAKET